MYFAKILQELLFHYMEKIIPGTSKNVTLFEKMGGRGTGVV